MERIRKKFDRIRHRHHSDSADNIHTDKKKRRFPKLHIKFKFLKKFRHQKPGKENEEEKPETEVSVPIKSAHSEDNILTKSQSENNINSNAGANKGLVSEVNGGPNNITINVECHEGLEEPEAGEDIGSVSRRSSWNRLTPDRLSGTSFGPGPLSRASMVSQKSASNMSVASFRKPEIRTVWTQTEMLEDSVATTQTSNENLDESVAVTQTSTENLLVPPSKEETSGTTSEFETPWTSMEFGIEDLARRNVENHVLAGYRDRIVRTLTFPNLDDAEADLCVELLRVAKIPYLSALNRKISIEGGRFNEQFIEFRGLDFLLILMEEIASAGLVSLHDVTKMMLVSECATSLVNSSSGRDFILDHGEHIVSFARGKYC